MARGHDSRMISSRSRQSSPRMGRPSEWIFPICSSLDEILSASSSPGRIMRLWTLRVFPVLLIDRTDLPGYHKPGDHLPRHQIISKPVFIFQHIEAVFRRLQFFIQFFPPCRMCKIPRPYDVDPLAPCPEVKMLRGAVFTRRP